MPRATPYRPFDVRLGRRRMLGDSLIRITLTGDDLDRCSPTLLDQRIKLVFTTAAEHTTLLTSPLTWYEAWQQLPPDDRPPMRTYTIAALRPSAREVDIDVVLHPGSLGPASRFAEQAPEGSMLIMVAPEDGAEGHDTIGLGWAPPPSGAQVWLIGDETALPAIRNIVATLPADTTGSVFVEVPAAGDVEDWSVPAGLQVRWCARDEGRTVHRALPWPDPDDAALLVDQPDADPDETIVWEQSEGTDRSVHGWVAGEAGWVKQLRVRAKAAGITPEQMSYMGYWRRGVGARG